MDCRQSARRNNDCQKAPKIHRAEIRMATLAFRAQHRNRTSDDAREAEHDMECNDRQKYGWGRWYLNAGYVGHFPSPRILARIYFLANGPRIWVRAHRSASKPLRNSSVVCWAIASRSFRFCFSWYFQVGVWQFQSLADAFTFSTPAWSVGTPSRKTTQKTARHLRARRNARCYWTVTDTVVACV